jgi:four helix bundle protein
MARTLRFDCQRLEVFRHAVEAVAVLDELAEELPEGRGYIRDQLRRAANSIALNIAEGAGEFLPAEKAGFYRMAKRSATECAGQILVCERLGLSEAPRIEAALDLARANVLDPGSTAAATRDLLGAGGAMPGTKSCRP